MPHYIVLADGSSVIGLWCTTQSVAAARQGLELSLTYPRCSVIVRRASDLDALKRALPQLQFGALQAESIAGAPPNVSACRV
jgi:hypothetical protein